jgi:lysophospholipase L1-like esterase
MRWLIAYTALIIAFTAPFLPEASAAVPASKAKKKKVTPKKPTKRRAVAMKAPPVSAAARYQAVAQVNEHLDRAPELPFDNAAALIPFFELLYRQQKGEMQGPLSILHYGDSHTAADEWTGYLRQQFQSRFGDGGSGYSLAGRPYTSYHRLDVRSGESHGWVSDGLLSRSGDGLYGLGGVSISTKRPQESVYLVAECERMELYYLRQPGGGSIDLYDNDGVVERISTDGTTGPGYYRHSTYPGTHRFELRTVERAPVRVFGWVAENGRGVTYETLGINGAQADIAFNWDEKLLAEHISRRNPALIVFAYGTNDAGNRDWNSENYRAMFSALLQRFRKAAPTASMLVVGPPDRFYRQRTQWLPYEKIDMIVAAQRDAALANGCAFWDLRAKMGGKGSMREWVLAGLAQYDHVHFTGAGYRLIGNSVFQDLMSQFETFLRVRQQLLGQYANGQPSENH